MVTAAPQVSFSEYVLEVRDMVGFGLSLADVEGAVADADLSEDSKAALWLVAWSAPRGADGRPAPARRADPPWAAESVSGRPVPRLRWS